MGNSEEYGRIGSNPKTWQVKDLFSFAAQRKEGVRAVLEPETARSPKRIDTTPFGGYAQPGVRLPASRLSMVRGKSEVDSNLVPGNRVEAEKGSAASEVDCAATSSDHRAEKGYASLTTRHSKAELYRRIRGEGQQARITSRAGDLGGKKHGKICELMG